MAKQSSDTPPSAKARLLDAALDVFGQYGYNGATTRMIAGKAGVNIASIPYYFNGKEGLYRAMIGEIVKVVREQIGEIQNPLEEASSRENCSPQQAQLLVEKLLEKIIGFMIGAPQARRVSRIILQEQLQPTSAFDLIFKGFMEPMLNTISQLLSIIAPSLSNEEAKLRSIALVGQVAVFRIARETVAQAMEMEGYSPEEFETIRDVILQQSRATLQAMRKL